MIESGPRDGPLVVLLHGWPQTPSAWSSVVPALADAGYRVVAPAQRGYSADHRPLDRGSYRTDLLADDVLALASSLGVDRFSVVGHDWGGAVAWVLGARHPARVESMCSVSTPHPAAMASVALVSLQAVRSLYAAWFQVPVMPEAVLLAGGGRVLRTMLGRSGLDASHANEYVAAMREPGALTAALNWYRGAAVSSLARLEDVTVPTLYVWGSADPALGRAAAEATRERVTGPYRFVPLEGVGHWIPEQHPELLVPPLLEHLAASAT